MTVHVEFYGTVARRAGLSGLNVQADNLGEALAAIAVAVPQLQDACIAHGRLRSGYLASVNGRLFSTNPSTLLQPGDTVLILSADAGG
jgi:molybdopterin converting factor small subunit